MIKESKNVKIYQKFFTDKIAQSYENKIDVFISDIRTMDDADRKKSTPQEWEK